MGGTYQRQGDKVTPEAKELANAAKRLQKPMFTRTSDENDYPFLASVTRAVDPELWSQSPHKAYRAALARALAKLPETEPEKWPLTWRYIGEFLFAFHPFDLPDGRPAYKYANFIDKLKDELGLTKTRESDFSRLTHELRERLAAILREMAKPRQEATVVTPQASVTLRGFAHTQVKRTPYVPRHELQRVFLDHHKNGEKIIALIGVPGSGKTRFAMHIAQHVAEMSTPSEIVWLQADDENVALEVIAQTLDHREHKTASMDVAALKREFKKTVASGNAPTVLVIDNVLGLGFLKSVLPARPKSITVITGPCDLWEESASPPVRLHVGSLSQSEAITLFVNTQKEETLQAIDNDAARSKMYSLLQQTQLEGLSEPAASLLPQIISRRPAEHVLASLALIVGYNPRAIEQLATFIAEDTTMIRPLSEEFRRNPFNVLDVAARANDATIRMDYSRFLRELDKNVPAKTLLELMIIGLEPCGADTMGLYLGPLLKIAPENNSVRSSVTRRAFSVLCEYPFISAGCGMDILSMSVLRALLDKERKLELARLVHDVSIEILRERFQQFLATLNGLQLHWDDLYAYWCTQARVFDSLGNVAVLLNELGNPEYPYLVTQLDVWRYVTRMWKMSAKQKAIEQ